jgi:hypothetical protein
VKVSSPIGELPFEPRRLRVSRQGLDIDGAMGAWPAHVHVDASDLPALARLLPLRALTFAVAGGLLLAVGGRRACYLPTRRRRSRHV